MYQELTQGSSFAIDSKGVFFVSNTAYLITGKHLDYLLQMLNSKLIEWAYRTFYGTLIGGNGLRWLSQNILDLPIPIYKDLALYNCIINDGDIASIYKLFALSDKEINYIETQ